MPPRHRASLRLVGLILYVIVVVVVAVVVAAAANDDVRKEDNPSRRLVDAAEIDRSGNNNNNKNNDDEEEEGDATTAVADDGACRDDNDDDDEYDDDDDERCRRHENGIATIRLPNDSRLCKPPESSYSSYSSVERYYRRGASAQAYKPNSPTKTTVCHHHHRPGGGLRNDPSSSSSGGGGKGEWGGASSWNVANWPLWRVGYDDDEVVALVVVGDIYGCRGAAVTPPPREDEDPKTMMTMEVWQPRPDGTYSSLRPGIEEGECRASVPVVAAAVPDDDGGGFSNLVGGFRYDTLAPGSTGIFGGLVPPGGGGAVGWWGRDLPPYGPGGMHVHLNVGGYRPFLGAIYASDLVGDYDGEGGGDDDDDGRRGGRFRFRGWDLRPHHRRVADDDEAGGGDGGIEILSVTRISIPGYDLALEVRVDVFLVETAEEGGGGVVSVVSPTDVFCSSSSSSSRGGLMGRIRSFFKEPLSICYPSLLDFFSL